MRRSRTLALAGLAVGSTALALLGAEIVLRWTTPETFGQTPNERQYSWLVDDPILGFANRPDFTHPELRINRLGFRGAEMAPPGSGMRRIVCLGDSSTFGLRLDGVPGEPEKKRRRFDNYSDELARLLGEEGRSDVEVVNAGVIGYTSSHGLRLLVTRVLALEPAVVTVRFGLNDHKIVSPRSGRRIQEPDRFWLREPLYRFAGWRLMRLGLRAYRSATWLRPGGDPIYWVAPARFAADLRRFAELARQHRFHLLFIDYPLRPLDWGEHPHDVRVYRPAGQASLADFHALHARYQALLQSVATEEGVPLLRTRDAFGRRADPLFGEWDFVHPNERGARELARLLLAKLAALDWLPELPPSR